MLEEVGDAGSTFDSLREPESKAMTAAGVSPCQQDEAAWRNLPSTCEYSRINSQPEHDDPLGSSLEGILEQTAAPDLALASGSAAALSVALGAALVASVVRTLPGSPETHGLTVQAEGLRLRSAEQVERNRSAYQLALSTLAARKEDPGYRDVRIRTALEGTLEVLALIGGTGADTAQLAAEIARMASAEVQPDAASAAILAESGSRVAALLVDANLLSTAGSPIHEAVAAELRSATAARERACAATDVC